MTLVSVPDLQAHSGHRSAWLLGGLGAVLLVLAGCSHSQTRAQADEESEAQRYSLPTIGDRTTVGNAIPVPLGGVGLVTGLEGSGGDCPHDTYRTMLNDTCASGE